MQANPENPEDSTMTRRQMELTHLERSIPGRRPPLPYRTSGHPKRIAGRSEAGRWLQAVALVMLGAFVLIVIWSALVVTMD